MSEGVEVSVQDLHDVLNALRVLVPKGETEMPIGVCIKSGELIITCIQGCVYQSTIQIDDMYSNMETTVLYKDISPLLPATGNVYFEFNSTHLTISGEGFDADFPVAFSVISTYDFSNVKYVSLKSSIFLSGIKTIMGMGFEKFYNKVAPVSIWNSIAIQKFPNIWVQVRFNGFEEDAVIDTNHLRLLNYFNPNMISRSTSNTLIFKSNSAVLQIPCKPVLDKNAITDLMTDVISITTLSIGSYLDKLRSISKFNSREHCRVSLYDNGLRTTVTNSSASMSSSIGNVTTAVRGVFELPLQLWIQILKGVGSDSVEVLYGGEKVCLRTPFTIIVVHVMS